MVTQTALYLGKSRPWDVFMPVHFDTDRVLHQLWHYLDPDHPWRTEREDKEPVVRDYFRSVDESVARLLALADDETLVMVLSDHGMGRANNFIVLNNWLLDNELLQLKRDPWTRLKGLMFRRGFTLRNVHQLLDRVGLARQAEYVAGYFVDHLLKLIFLSFLDVELEPVESLFLWPAPGLDLCERQGPGAAGHRQAGRRVRSGARRDRADGARFPRPPHRPGRSSARCCVARRSIPALTWTRRPISPSYRKSLRTSFSGWPISAIG